MDETTQDDQEPPKQVSEVQSSSLKVRGSFRKASTQYDSDEMDEEDLPEWKKRLLYQKKLRATAAERMEREKEREKEAKYVGMPEWKVKLMKKKEAEKEMLEAEEREKNLKKNEKLERINSMPEWKRKLYLAKNPEAVQ